MKKYFKIILLISILCSITITLSACTKDNKNEQNNNESSIEISNEIEFKNVVANIEETENNENEENIEINRGKWENNKYSNEELDIEFTLPSTWNKYTNEQLKLMEDIQSQALDESQQGKIGNSLIYEVIASNSNGSSNIIITYEPELNITELEYLNIAKQQLENITTIKYKVLEQDSKMLGKNEYYVLNMEVISQETKQRIYILNKEKGIIGIIITAKTENELSEIEAFFNN